MKLVNIIWGKFLWLFGLEKFMERNKSYYISTYSFYSYLAFLLILPVALVKGVLNKAFCFSEHLNFFSQTCAAGILFEGLSLWPILIGLVFVILNLFCLIQAFFKAENERAKYIFHSKILLVFACLFFLLGIFLYLSVK